MLRAFDLVRGLLHLQPQRVFALEPSQQRRFLVATDATQEGSAGALVVTPSKQRKAMVLMVDPRLFQVWDDKEDKISQLELCVIMMTLATFSSAFRGYHGIWWVENICGRSIEELDIMSGAGHAMLCGLQCNI